jgi:hypothetical protein
VTLSIGCRNGGYGDRQTLSGKICAKASGVEWTAAALQSALLTSRERRRARGQFNEVGQTVQRFINDFRRVDTEKESCGGDSRLAGGYRNLLR